MSTLAYAQCYSQLIALAPLKIRFLLSKEKIYTFRNECEKSLTLSDSGQTPIRAAKLKHSAVEAGGLLNRGELRRIEVNRR